MIGDRGMDPGAVEVTPDRLGTATSTSSSRLAIRPDDVRNANSSCGRMPADASSNTMHWSGTRPSAAAPARSGRGRARPCHVVGGHNADRVGDTAGVKRASARQRRPEVTNAHEPGDRR